MYMRKKILISLIVLWMVFIFYISHQLEKISTVESDKIIHIIKNTYKNEEVKIKLILLI